MKNPPAPQIQRSILKMISNASNQENNGDEGQETVRCHTLRIPFWSGLDSLPSAVQSLFYLYPLILHEESPGATNTKEHFYPPKWHSVTYTLWKKVAILKMISNASNQENNGDEGQECMKNPPAPQIQRSISIPQSLISPLGPPPVLHIY
jgi:hypothetical protein